MKLNDKIIFLTPLLSFLVLFIPYSWVNQQFLVKWFGCGCPKIDKFGNMISDYFNANDVTKLFWSVIALCSTVAAFFLSKKISKEKWWLRVLYVVGIFVVSLFVARRFTQMMMWR